MSAGDYAMLKEAGRLAELEAENARLRAELEALKGEVISKGRWFHDGRRWVEAVAEETIGPLFSARLVASPAPPEEEKP